MTQPADNSPRDPFSSFISGLNMDGVDGISCATVHPIIEEIVQKVAEHDHWSDLVNRLEQQVSACLSNEAADWLIDHAGELDGLELMADAEGNVDRVIMTPDALAETLSDYADLVRICDQAVRARLGDSKEAPLPLAFLRQQLLILQLVEHYERDNTAAVSRTMGLLAKLTHQYQALLRAIGMGVSDAGADDAPNDDAAPSR